MPPFSSCYEATTCFFRRVSDFWGGSSWQIPLDYTPVEGWMLMQAVSAASPLCKHKWPALAVVSHLISLQRQVTEEGFERKPVLLWRQTLVSLSVPFSRLLGNSYGEFHIRLVKSSLTILWLPFNLCTLLSHLLSHGKMVSSFLSCDKLWRWSWWLLLKDLGKNPKKGI